MQLNHEMKSAVADAAARKARDDLAERGFARFKPDLTKTEAGALADLVEEIPALPRDPYDPQGTRRRRYGKAWIPAGTSTLLWAADETDSRGNAVARYWQENKNPEFPDVERAFPTLTPTMKENVLLNKQMLRDFALTQWAAIDCGRAIQVGVHIIAMCPGAEKAAAASPNALHRDGEPFTAAHLVQRINITGGKNWIAPPELEGKQPQDVPDQVLARFDLEDVFDSYIVRDAAVTHHVDPVRRTNPRIEARRVVLLIDFSPLVPRLEP